MLDKLQNRRLNMKKDIYSNIKDSDALESFFECITSCSINSEGVDCTTACYVKHLEPNNINYPLKFSWAKLIDNCYISLMVFPPPQVIFGLFLLSIAVVLIWDIRYNPFGEDEDGI